MTGRLLYLADHLIPASDAAPRRVFIYDPLTWIVSLYFAVNLRITFGCRDFYHAGPTVWNSLPHDRRNSDSFDGFKRFLKTHVFSHY